MKKILALCMVVLIGISIFGCAKEPDQPTPEEILEEQGYLVEELTYEDPEFDVEITNLVIDVTSRKIHLHLNINDYSIYYKFYVVYKFAGRKQERVLRLHAYNMRASMDWTFDLLYDEERPTEAVTFEIGRLKSTADLIIDIPASDSAGFKYTINRVEERAQFKDGSVYFFNDPYGSTDGTVSLVIKDESQIIHKVKFVIKELFTDHVYEDEKTINVNAMMRTEDKLFIYEVIFQDLLFDVRYQVEVYASGFDGVYQFEDVFVDMTQSILFD